MNGNAFNETEERWGPSEKGVESSPACANETAGCFSEENGGHRGSELPGGWPNGLGILPFP